MTSVDIAPSYKRPFMSKFLGNLNSWWKTKSPFEQESYLVSHARRELQLAGLFHKDSDYDGMLGKAVLDIIKIFANQGHSGMSAHYALDLVNRLGNFEVLMPLTDNPSEWMFIDESNSVKPCWQSRRQSNCFSEDGGKTYYNIDEKGRPLHESEYSINKIEKTK
jgi:hypothetical protein